MADFQGGLQGALGGGLALAGTGNPWAIGAGAIGGGLLGLFGGGDRRRKQQQRLESALDRENTALLTLFQQRANEAQNQSPTDTAFYRAGEGRLMDVLTQQGRADQARLAQLGAQGGELEIAQTAQRGNVLGRGLRDLVGDADRVRRQEEQSALAQLLQAQNMRNSSTLAQLGRGDQQQAQNSQFLSNALALAPFLLGPSNTTTTG